MKPIERIESKLTEEKGRGTPIDKLDAHNEYCVSLSNKYFKCRVNLETPSIKIINSKEVLILNSTGNLPITIMNGDNVEVLKMPMFIP